MTTASRKIVNKTFINILLIFFFAGILLIFMIELPNYQKSIKMLNKNYYYFFHSQSAYIEKLFSSYEENAELISNSSLLISNINKYYGNHLTYNELTRFLNAESTYYLKQFKNMFSIIYFDKDKNILYRNEKRIPFEHISLPTNFVSKAFVQGIIKFQDKMYIKVFSPIKEDKKIKGYIIIFFNSESLDNLVEQKYSINNTDLFIDLYLIKERDKVLKYSNYKIIDDIEFVKIINKASHRISKGFYKKGKYLYNFKRINYSNWFIGFKIDYAEYEKVTRYSFFVLSIFIIVIFCIILIIIYFLLKPFSQKVILTIDEMDEKIKNLTCKLKAERDKYLNYLDNIGNIFIVQNLKGELLYINKQGENLLGYNKEELLGKQWIKKVHGKKSKIIVNELLKKIELKKYEDIKFTVSPLYNSSNQKKIIQWINSFVEDENGNIIEIFSSGIDITDKIKLFEEIDNNTKQLNFIINSLNMYIWQQKIFNDGTHKLTYLSPSFEKVTGITIEVALYSNIDYVNFVIPEDRNIILDLRKSVQLGKEYSGEYRFRKANGQIIWLKDFAYPFKKEKDFTLINGFSIEITREKEKEGYLKSIFDAISELKIGIIMYGTIDGKEGIITYANKAFSHITEYSLDELVNRKTVFDLLSDESKNLVLKRYRKRLAGEKPVSHYKVKLITKTGKIITLNSMITTQKIENTTYVIAILIDITEKENLEQQLFVKQKMEAIGLITSGIAHDLNNILGGMLGYLELMKLELKDPHFIEYVNQIMEGGNRAKRFISNLLGYSRKNKIEKKILNINEIIISALNLLKPTMKKDIDIVLDLNKEINCIEGDPSQIEQIILNLCINAAQAMPDGGTLTIKTDNFYVDDEFSKSHYNLNKGNYIILLIEDTGIGMDKNTLNKIFDPFFTTKSKKEGTGLGLATVYSIIENHNGIISVYSEKGKGTIFNIYLPVTDKDVVSNINHLKNKSVFTGEGTILVIDDELILQDVLTRMLNKIGFDVITAGNGRIGLELYKKNREKIKIVLLDINMPEMSGKVTFKELKKINPELKVLIATGFTLNEEVQELLDMGADGYIKKPFDLLTLSQKIGEILKDDKK